MPVILPAEVDALWLDSTVADVERLMALLRPYAADEMEAYPVSALVNAFQNDGPELVVPAAPSSSQPALF
jgi:putative SOS response-associated peptidase YedK